MKSRSIFYTFALLSCLTLFSCSVEERPPLQEEVTIMVQLNIIPSIEYGELPLSRATSKERSGIYAINVVWKGNRLTTFQPYASGLFNDISEVRIGLIAGYEYRFDCIFLKNDELPYCENEKYGRPFSLTKEGLVDAQITNRLKISINPPFENSEFHQFIYNGDTHIKADSITKRPLNQHRYYGCGTIDFKNPTETPTVTIELKRAYYTLRFTTSKELKENDSIKITTDYTDPFYITHSGEIPYTSDERLVTMKTVSNTHDWGGRWDGKVNEVDPMPISVLYRSAKTAKWTSVFNQVKIQLQRNKNNVINIVDIDTEAQGNGNISFEEGGIGGLPNEDNNLEINK